MSGSYWRLKAAPIIAQVLEDTRELPVKEQKRALRDAYPFGERRYHPYKIWLDEIERQTGRKQPLITAHLFHKKEADPRQEDMFA